jgi:hypothetical protein
MKPILLTAVAFVSTFCFKSSVAQENGILSATSQDLNLIAEEAFEQMRIDQVSAPVFATCFVGGNLMDGPDPMFNGMFSFIGFYARRPSQNGKDQIRTWVSKDAVINGEFGTFAVTKDHFFDGETWDYRDEKMPGLRKVNPLLEGAKHRCSNYCIDSRAAIFQYGIGMSGHQVIDHYGNWSYYDMKLLSVEKSRDSLLAIFDASKGYRYFLTMDPKIEHRATHLAITKNGDKLGEGEANATVVNNIRWGKSRSGHWVGEAGENTSYLKGTKSKHSESRMITWKAAWWFGDKEVPASLFDEKDLQQTRGELLVKFVDEIDAVEAIPDFELPEKTNTPKKAKRK